MAVEARDGVLCFSPSMTGQVVGLVLSLLFGAAGIALMILARGPAMPGPLFVAIPAVFVVTIVRSVGLKLTVDEGGVYQSAPLGTGWSLAWREIASWDVRRSQSQYSVSFRDTAGSQHRVSSWLLSRSELRTFVDHVRQRLGPPASG